MPRKRNPRRSPLCWWQRLVCASIVIVPPLTLGYRLVGGALDYLDHILAQSAPLASALASGALRREVHIGGLTPFLSVREVGDYYKRRDKLGTIPIVVTDIAVANGVRLATSGALVSAPRVTLYLSVPDLLSGRGDQAVTRIDVQSPRVFLLRRANNTFNVQDLVPKATRPSPKPFVTTITLSDGALRFTDAASKYAAAQTNEFYPVSGSATLGARSLRIAVKATPQPKFPAAVRVSGALDLGVTLAQGEPGTRPDAAQPGDPQYTLRAAAPGADVPYWTRYFIGAIPNVSVAGGRAADISVSLVGATVAQTQRATLAKTAAPPPSVLFAARVSGVSARVKGFPFAVENITAPVRYTSAGGLLSFDATATVAGAPLQAAGSVWNVGTLPVSPVQVATRFSVSGVPLARIVSALKITLPRGLTVGGAADASGFVSGSPTDLSGSGAVRVGRVALAGKAAVTNVSADLVYARGTLQASNVSARTDLGGSVSGGGTVRFAEQTPRGLRILPANRLSAQFAASASGVSLARVAGLLNASGVARRYDVSGAASGTVSGSVNGTDVILSADVSAFGLHAGGVPFPVAQARILVSHNAVTLPFARLLSPVAGSVFVSGGSSAGAVNAANAPLDLRFAVRALDAGRAARAVGIAGVSGVVSATGTVSGTPSAPRVAVSRFTVLNPRYRQYNAQSVVGTHVVWANNTLTIPANAPVAVQRYPASVSASGTVTGLFTAHGKKTARPILDLLAHVRNLDYSTVAPFLPQPKMDAKTPLALAGVLTTADAHITGSATDPTVSGAASLRRVVIGDYPIDTAAFKFAYQNGRVAVTGATATAGAGRVQARATLTRSGYVYGAFDAPDIDLGRLSFLVDKTVSIGGHLAVSGTFSGTRDRPVVTVNVAPSDIDVDGTPIQALQATNIRYIANLAAGEQRLVVPRISLSQAGNTRLLLEDGSYDVKSGAFGGTLTAETLSLASLIGAVRQSGFARTKQGRAAFAQFDKLPAPLDFALPTLRPDDTDPARSVPTNRVFVSGTVGKTVSLRATGDIYVTGLTLGRFKASAVHVTLGRGTDTRVGPSEPNFAAKVNASDLHFGDVSAQRFTASGSIAGANYSLNSASLVSGAGTINASGTVKNGRIQALLDSNAVSLDVVRVFAPDFPVSGSLAVSVVATGNIKAPDVEASIEGSNLEITPRNVAGETVKKTAPGAADLSKPAAPTRLSLVRAVARLAPDKTGHRYLDINDAQVAVENVGRIEADAHIPFSYTAPTLPPTEPISLSLRLPKQNLSALAKETTDNYLAATAKSKKAKKAEMTGFTAGTAEGNISLSGTLRAPELAGRVTVADAAFNFPRIAGRETLNRVSDFGLDATLDGSEIAVKSTLTLAAPNGGKGNAGNATVTGTVVVSELEDLLNRLSSLVQGVVATKTGIPRRSALAPDETFASGATLALKAHFAGFEPSENNLFGFKEVFHARLNGDIAVTGQANAPLIATPPGQPLRLAAVRATVPTIPPSDKQPADPTPGGPRFALDFDLPTKSNIEIQPGIFAAEVTGNAHIGGSLGEPLATGTFLTQGGVLQYYLRRFTVDKNGIVTFNYSGNRGSYSLDNVRARTSVYLPPGSTIEGGGSPTALSQPAVEGAGTRYKIIAILDGTRPFVGPDNADPLKIKWQTDPYLSEPQIVALLVGGSQFASVASGRLADASTQLFSSALSSSLLPSLFSPIQDRVATAFGLETFTVDYSPSAPITLNLLKRFPAPFQRFLVSYSRTVQNSAGTRAGGPVPYNLGLLFELYQIRSKPGRPVPRISVGVSTDEQQNFTSYLRTTILY